MKSLAVTVLVMLLSVLFPFAVYATDPCCMLSSGAQEQLLGNVSQEAQKLFIQLAYSFTLMDRLKEGSTSRSVEDVKNEGRFTTIPTRMEMTKYILSSAYNFSPKFTLFATVPYVRNTMSMQMFMAMPGMGGMKEWMEHEMDPVEGLGDLKVMGLYRIYANDEARSTGPTDTITIGAGIKTPTGSSTKKTSDGSFVHMHMQPGSGSWDPVISLIYTKSANPYLFQADATYQYATRNPNGYESGNSLTANFSGRYALLSFFNVAAGLAYLHNNKASDREGKYTELLSVMDNPANTGGDSIWISPGIQVIPIRNSLIDLKVQFPLWERVNGTQLVSSYRLLVGVSYSF